MTDPIDPTDPTDPTDPRPHVAMLLELAALGWYVSTIRPDRSAPVLWRVTIGRYDGFASISITEADPDDALDELLRYARTDAETPRASTTERRAALRLLPRPEEP